MENKNKKILVMVVLLLLFCLALSGVLLANAMANKGEEKDDLLVTKEQFNSGEDSKADDKTGASEAEFADDMNESESDDSKENATLMEKDDSSLTRDESDDVSTDKKNDEKNVATKDAASKSKKSVLSKKGNTTPGSSATAITNENGNNGQSNSGSGGSDQGTSGTSKPTPTPKKKADDVYVPPTEDINLSDKVTTDKDGAILFPFISYE